MFVRNIEDCREIVAGDNTRLRELFNPLEDPLQLRYSLAVARVEPGGTTFLHRLCTSEVYYILRGHGEMHVGDELRPVAEGDAVYIPPGATQQIENTGVGELEFVCIVDPAWRVEDEEILP